MSLIPYTANTRNQPDEKVTVALDNTITLIKTYYSLMTLQACLASDYREGLREVLLSMPEEFRPLGVGITNLYLNNLYYSNTLEHILMDLRQAILDQLQKDIILIEPEAEKIQA
jgi:hypothetical protein